MPIPTKPTAPLPALRSDPDTFRDRVEANILFWETLLAYIEDTNTYVDGAMASLLASDLPDLADKANQMLKVNAGEDGLAFVNPLDRRAGDLDFPVIAKVVTGGVATNGYVQGSALRYSNTAGETGSILSGTFFNTGKALTINQTGLFWRVL
jgi:hypothetical protein